MLLEYRPPLRVVANRKQKFKISFWWEVKVIELVCSFRIILEAFHNLFLKNTDTKFKINFYSLESSHSFLLLAVISAVVAVLFQNFYVQNGRQVCLSPEHGPRHRSRKEKGTVAMGDEYRGRRGEQN